MTRRILVSYLSLTLLILLALGVPLGTIYGRHERDGFAADVERDAVILAEQAEPDIAAGRPAPVLALAGRYAASTGARVLVADAGGRLMASTAARPPPADPAVAEALTNRHAVGYRRASGGGTELYVAVPARTGGNVQGAVLLTYPAGLVDAQATRFWLALAALGTLTLGVVALAGLLLARWITRPIRVLEDAAAAIGRGADLSTARIGPPELRRLADRLTETSRRLHRLLTAQRSFAAVASHQLRSPLTALRLRLENLEPGLRPAGPEPGLRPDPEPGLRPDPEPGARLAAPRSDAAPDARADLDAAIAEVDRLTDLVQGLLSLAHLENTVADRAPVDLDALVTAGIDGWSAYAAEQGVTVARSPARLGTALAMPGAVEQILDNLLSNAVRAAPPGTTITVGAAPDHHDPATVELHVVDEGPGLSETERVRAFDRFWRAPESPPDGSGLGLSIVRQLAEVSGGEATLRAAAGGGIDATVRLPAAHGGD
ncbi:HAMP domain-containing sensor histidine kinase [Actinoplanes sp. DH11]|uniref:sensor histidine kinase n=1 Tax=Actinoplanes sp. DH11 TaxID=2857011 RepID=UPI001E418FB5|nr:HAMP domain-containing sensor histidine kinase [Actinoplanes sp. DH11]